MPEADIVTDYLVIGAGFSGLSFVDELLTNSSTSSITIVDQRDAPGGHWNDSYPFVKLHQPSTFYGVNSTELANPEIEKDGFNRGLLRLSGGPEITAYCHALMREKLLPSGRVTYLPLTEYRPDGSLQGVLSGEIRTVNVRRKLVDASWYTNAIPLTHTRPFTVDKDVACIPPNDLPRQAEHFQHYTVLGGGKTAMDTCLWLLGNGCHPSRLRWVIPRDYWFLNRAKYQTGPEFFMDVFNGLADRMESIAQAENAMDYAYRMEKCGNWIRLDPGIETPMFHAATMAIAEVEELRKIKDIVRLGHVTRLETLRMILTKGALTASLNTLYIDCTASAIRPKPLVPVFQPGKIIIQLVQYPLVPYSAALIGFLESLGDMPDSERNKFVGPLVFANTVEGYVTNFPAEFRNRINIAQNEKVREWQRRGRLDGFTRAASLVKPEETEKVAVLERMKKASVAAFANAPKLAASAKQKANL